MQQVCHWFQTMLLLNYLRRRRRLCFWFGLFVCLSVGLLANLWTDFDEIFWRGRAWLKDQVVQFLWRSGSRFGSGSPKSEIRILWIGGGLCSLSASSLAWERWSRGIHCALCVSTVSKGIKCLIADYWHCMVLTWEAQFSLPWATLIHSWPVVKVWRCANFFSVKHYHDRFRPVNYRLPC